MDQLNEHTEEFVVHVREAERVQMLKLKIYGARIVKNFWIRMQSWEQVVGIVFHLTACLPSSSVSLSPGSTRRTSYRALIGNLHENESWQILGHVQCETRRRFINIQYNFTAALFLYAPFPTHFLTHSPCHSGEERKGLRFLWFMKGRDFLDVFLRPVFEFYKRKGKVGKMKSSLNPWLFELWDFSSSWEKIFQLEISDFSRLVFFGDVSCFVKVLGRNKGRQSFFY